MHRATRADSYTDSIDLTNFNYGGGYYSAFSVPLHTKMPYTLTNTFANE